MNSRPMSNIDKQALREAAERATPGDWKYSTFDCAITDDTSSLAVVRMDSGHLNDEQSALNGAFIAAANPATVLALLDELEAAERQSAVRLEALNNRVSEINTMRYRIKTLNGTVDIVDGQRDLWMERCKEAEVKLEAAEKRIAELEMRTMALRG